MFGGSVKETRCFFPPAVPQQSRGSAYIRRYRAITVFAAPLRPPLTAANGATSPSPNALPLSSHNFRALRAILLFGLVFFFFEDSRAYRRLCSDLLFHKAAEQQKGSTGPRSADRPGCTTLQSSLQTSALKTFRRIMETQGGNPQYMKINMINT